MTVASVSLSSSLQALIDLRLDTLDRMLLGRVPRQDRVNIVNEVEAQIFELLQQRGTDDLDRDHVLAVLARLDPPEAYVPEESDEGQPSARREIPVRATRPVADQSSKASKVGGIVGLSFLSLLLVIPVAYTIGMMTQSDMVILIPTFGVMGLMFIGGIVAFVLGVYTRLQGAWAVVGVVTGVLSFLISLAMGLILLLMIMS